MPLQALGRLGGPSAPARSDHWRRLVRRLAAVLLDDGAGGPARDHHALRRCRYCAGQRYADDRIWLASEWYACPDCSPEDDLYEHGARPNGYWYATCLTGADPDAPATALGEPVAAISPTRRAGLDAACAAVGLVFGSVTAPSAPSMLSTGFGAPGAQAYTWASTSPDFISARQNPASPLRLPPAPLVVLGSPGTRALCVGRRIGDDEEDR